MREEGAKINVPPFDAWVIARGCGEVDLTPPKHWQKKGDDKTHAKEKAAERPM